MIILPRIQATRLVNNFPNLTISNEEANTPKIHACFQG